MNKINTYKIFEAKIKRDWDAENLVIINYLKDTLLKNGVDVKYFEEICYDVTDMFGFCRMYKSPTIHFIGTIIGKGKTYVNSTIILNNATYLKSWELNAEMKRTLEKINLPEVKVYFNYEVRIFPSDVNLDRFTEKVKEATNDIEAIKDRCESEGISFKFTTIKNQITLFLSVELDKESFKQEKDYHSTIPKHLISRFEEFACRKNLTEEDRRELAELFASSNKPDKPE